MNDSMTHSKMSLILLLDESTPLNKFLEWMIQWQIEFLTVTFHHLEVIYNLYIKRQVMKGEWPCVVERTVCEAVLYLHDNSGSAAA